MFFVATDASKPAVAAVRSTEGKNCAFATWIRFAILLFVCWLFVFALAQRQTFGRRQLAAGVVALALIVVTLTVAVAGCGGGKKTATIIPFTPAGTYKLTVRGSAQNAARGYTCTLVVAAGK